MPRDASYAAAPVSYAAASPYQPPYTLDAGDKLRVVVFGQDGISNTYIVDAGGNVSLPLVGSVAARGITTQQLSQRIAARLKQGYVRDPHVTVEVETYRPFFILGEVTTPGQYPYVADMTVEKAVAIAGGFAPRAYKDKVELTRSAPGQQMKGDVPLSYPLAPRRHRAGQGALVLALRNCSARPREGGDPDFLKFSWIPAHAGMSGRQPPIPSYICRGIPACGSRPDRRRPYCSWRARRNKSRARRPGRRRFPLAAASS